MKDELADLLSVEYRRMAGSLNCGADLPETWIAVADAARKYIADHPQWPIPEDEFSGSLRNHCFTCDRPRLDCGCVENGGTY